MKRNTTHQRTERTATTATDHAPDDPDGLFARRLALKRRILRDIMLLSEEVRAELLMPYVINED